VWIARVSRTLVVRFLAGAAFLIVFAALALAARRPAPVPLVPVVPNWTLSFNNLLTLPPAYDGTRGYFPIEGDRIAAYDLVPGTLKWIARAKPTSTPAAGGGLLLIAEADALTALHAKDGTLAWQLPFAEKLVGRLVVDNGWLVTATASGSILAFRASDGQLIWRRDLGSPAHAPPALAADRIYIPTADHRIVALAIATGEPIWERRLGGVPNEILALEDRLYVGSKDDFFYCLMTRDGRIDWRWRTGGDVIGMPVADDRRVYFVALDNMLRALDRTSGGQRWLRPLTLRPIWGPVLAGGTIVVGGQASSLRAFNVADGVTAGDVAAGAEVAAAPYALEDPVSKLPMVLMVTRDIAKGGEATMVSRSIEPVLGPVGPLPNAITLAPTLAPSK
jgi:outer membrane protein assembly factor BamB